MTPTVTGSADVTIAPASLSFSTSNWDTAKTVTVSAAEDSDAEDGRSWNRLGRGLVVAARGSIQHARQP